MSENKNPTTHRPPPQSTPSSTTTPEKKSAAGHPGTYTPEQRKSRVAAYLRLVQLGASPAVTFDYEHDKLYAGVYADAVKEVEQERYDEIIKNRKILGLGTGYDQMNVPEPVSIRNKRIKEERKNDSSYDADALVIGPDNKVRTQEKTDARGVMTTGSFGA